MLMMVALSDLEEKKGEGGVKHKNKIPKKYDMHSVNSTGQSDFEVVRPITNEHDTRINAN